MTATTPVESIASTSTDAAWLVIAQLGPPHNGGALDADGFVSIPAVVMARRPNQADALAECERRNARNDGRHYFAMAAADFAAANPDEACMSAARASRSRRSPTIGGKPMHADPKLTVLMEIGAEYGIHPEPTESAMEFGERLMCELDGRVEILQDRMAAIVEAFYPQPGWPELAGDCDPAA